LAVGLAVGDGDPVTVGVAVGVVVGDGELVTVGVAVAAPMPDQKPPVRL
jgi:hypothetical protein